MEKEDINSWLDHIQGGCDISNVLKEKDVPEVLKKNELSDDDVKKLIGAIEDNSNANRILQLLWILTKKYENLNLQNYIGAILGKIANDQRIVPMQRLIKQLTGCNLDEHCGTILQKLSNDQWAHNMADLVKSLEDAKCDLKAHVKEIIEKIGQKQDATVVTKLIKNLTGCNLEKHCDTILQKLSNDQWAYDMADLVTLLKDAGCNLKEHCSTILIKLSDGQSAYYMEILVESLKNTKCGLDEHCSAILCKLRNDQSASDMLDLVTLLKDAGCDLKKHCDTILQKLSNNQWAYHMANLVKLLKDAKCDLNAHCNTILQKLSDDQTVVDKKLYEFYLKFDKQQVRKQIGTITSQLKVCKKNEKIEKITYRGQSVSDMENLVKLLEDAGCDLSKHDDTILKKLRDDQNADDVAKLLESLKNAGCDFTILKKLRDDQNADDMRNFSEDIKQKITSNRNIKSINEINLDNINNKPIININYNLTKKDIKIDQKQKEKEINTDGTTSNNNPIINILPENNKDIKSDKNINPNLIMDDEKNEKEINNANENQPPKLDNVLKSTEYTNENIHIDTKIIKEETIKTTKIARNKNEDIAGKIQDNKDIKLKNNIKSDGKEETNMPIINQNININNHNNKNEIQTDKYSDHDNMKWKLEDNVKSPLLIDIGNPSIRNNENENQTSESDNLLKSTESTNKNINIDNKIIKEKMKGYKYNSKNNENEIQTKENKNASMAEEINYNKNTKSKNEINSSAGIGVNIQIINLNINNNIIINNKQDENEIQTPRLDTLLTSANQEFVNKYMSTWKISKQIEENERQEFKKAVVNQLSQRLKTLKDAYDSDESWQNFQNKLGEEKTFWKGIGKELSQLTLLNWKQLQEFNDKIDDIYDVNGFVTALQWIGCALSVALTLGLILMFDKIGKFGIGNIIAHPGLTRQYNRFQDDKDELLGKIVPLQEIDDQKIKNDDEI